MLARVKRFLGNKKQNKNRLGRQKTRPIMRPSPIVGGGAQCAAINLYFFRLFFVFCFREKTFVKKIIIIKRSDTREVGQQINNTTYCFLNIMIFVAWLCTMGKKSPVHAIINRLIQRALLYPSKGGKNFLE